MKLIVAGATGFVGQEVIRQSLRNPAITSIVALARRPVSPPTGVPEEAASKLKSVVVKDYDEYPDEVRKDLAGADACIWTVAITPAKSKAFPFEEVTRVCQTSTLAGLNAMHDAGIAQPFRFLYMSGTGAPRSPSDKQPFYMPEYSRMRGETENRVLSFAAEHKFEASVAKPGLIKRSLASTILAAGLKLIMVPSVSLEEVSAAMIHQVINGFEKEPLENDDLVRIGREALKQGGGKA
ncbi:putative nucleoside-diphosphate-sugar epimerase [Favolaschia claudopus]|uniref:Nucleoside-diphosphate-sugar epimerase n=1 Tax=Favolaschia claudopus TaxID=2862362 RepID=A0AAW0C3A1_9AGAR